MAAGISFQLPRGRDVGPLSKNFCRALLCLLVAVARLVGGLVLLAVACVSLWLAGFWLVLLRGELERAPTQ